MAKIITTRLGDKWCAELDKHPHIRAFASSRLEAVGRLACYFSSSLDLEIEHEAEWFPGERALDGLAAENASEPELTCHCGRPTLNPHCKLCGSCAADWAENASEEYIAAAACGFNPNDPILHESIRPEDVVTANEPKEKIHANGLTATSDCDQRAAEWRMP